MEGKEEQGFFDFGGPVEDSKVSAGRSANNKKLELDLFDLPTGPTDGYAEFLEDKQRREAEIAEVWALPVNAQVQIQITDMSNVIKGRLLIEEVPKKMNRKLPLKLRIGEVCFNSNEIESCLRVSADD